MADMWQRKPFRSAARDVLYAPSHRQDSTFYDLSSSVSFFNTSYGALTG